MTQRDRTGRGSVHRGAGLLGGVLLGGALVAGCSGPPPAAGPSGSAVGIETSVASDSAAPGSLPSGAAAPSALGPGAPEAAGAGGTGTPSPEPAGCPNPAAADTATAAGWIGYLAAHPDQVALVVDDGRGHTLRHRSTDAQPAASAAKIVHLAAYARAVDAGALDPEQPITVGEWERWYLPGLDGGAHPAALTELGIPLDADALAAADPGIEVTVDDLVQAMIRFSDNAASDLLRDRLGDAALQAVITDSNTGSVAGSITADAGEDAAPQPEPAAGVQIPSFLGSQIALLDPAGAPGDGAAELAAAQRYAADEAERQQVQALPVPPLGTQLTWADGTATASADTLAAVATDLVAAADDPTRPGARLARTHLEWPPTPDGTEGLGAKGGSLPGVLTEVFVLRRTDGTVGTASLMVRGMDAPAWTTAVGSFAHQELLLAALQSPDTLTALRCALPER